MTLPNCPALAIPSGRGMILENAVINQLEPHREACSPVGSELGSGAVGGSLSGVISRTNAKISCIRWRASVEEARSS